MTPSVMFVSLIFLAISMLVSWVLKSKFNSYGKIALQNGLSGREIAEKMLRENGIYDVKVVSVNGFLSDHYNPANKTVNLSPDVYQGRSIAAAAVAAHECGHAVQHARAAQLQRARVLARIHAFARGFYATKDTRTPFVLTVVSIAVNVVLSIAFAPLWGINGLALANSLATLVEAALLLPFM